ncbi:MULTISPECIES: RAD52 family DNA repair protein [unclassified Bradyrhizobium]|uniref:RAD52 family DNA repair protein n=2 Tax=Bradyrhizobium TaxID=374 RepID=UPI0028F091E6|nr:MULTISPECIES: RAD52 family DNA repair protein [unclassified Bradyrhizobium]
MSFTEDQKRLLDAPLSRSHVKTRAQAGRQLSYIEGWTTIAEANRIFGFDGWTRETIDIRCVSEREREIGAQKRPGWGVSYVAKVRVIALGVAREGVGAGHGIDVDQGQAHESAIKEAETDAMKRALMTFGNPFGLALYDKEQANVSDEQPQDPALRLQYIAECKTKIANFPDGDPRIGTWWKDERQARIDFGLTQADIDGLKDLVIAKGPKQGKAA